MACRLEVAELPDSDRIREVFEAMTDSFVTYLNPHMFLNELSFIDSKIKKEILDKFLYHPKEAMSMLLEWLLDQDDAAPSQMEFYNVLKFKLDEEGFLPHALISSDGINKWRNVSDMARLFVDLVDGDKFEILTFDTLDQVINILRDEKIINFKRSNNAIFEMRPLDAFMEILKSVRRNKPEWPFIVWDVLEKLHPSHFNSGVHQTENLTQMDLQIENPSETSFKSGLQTENSSTATSCSGLQTENSSTATFCSGLQTENSSTATSYSGLQTENPSSSDTASDNSGRTTSVNKFRKSQMPERKYPVVVSKEERREVEKLIEVGALSRSDVTVNERPLDTREGWKAKVQRPDHSDEDTDNEETELKRLAVGTPALNLRNYQKELAEEALEGKNTIICAPTGSGKTRVATHIIIKHLEKGCKKNPKKVCFFARTVPLAVQQYKSISKYLPDKYKAFLLTGDSPYSTSLKAFIPEHDVIILTPMILQNHFKLGLLKDLTEFTLLVFDECHHTRKSEPYNILMLSYLKLKFGKSPPSSPLPQVLGLTASFPAEKAKSQSDAIESVLQVCANLAADEISTVEVYKDELDQTVPVPIEEIKLLQVRGGDASVEKIISVMHKLENEAQRYGSDIASEDVKSLLSVGKIPSDRKSQQYNQWTSKLKTAAENIALTPKETLMPARILMIIAEYLKHYNVALEAHDLVHLEDVLHYLDACFKSFGENERNAARETKFYDYFRDLRKAMESFRHEENPNLSKLEIAIEKHLASKGEDSRGIVFVKTRALAEALASWLNRCGRAAISDLNATIFTGTNAPESEGGMTQAQQDECVERFRKGEVRLLIATSVAEEGIDVPECNLVIKYNHVGNEISTIQTKGRSRKQGGRSILLALSSIRDRELVNRYRAKMVADSVYIIRHMDAADRSSRIENLQRTALEELELDELVEDQVRRELKDTKFKMYCKKCRKTCVESDFLKTVFGAHRVVTDWNIWTYSNIRGIQTKFVDDVKITARVRCRASVEKSATCNGPLGTYLIYNGIGFLALSIKNFVFVEENETSLKPYARWKDVKYVINGIEMQDIKRYIEDSQRHPARSEKNPTEIVGSISEHNFKKENASGAMLETVQSELAEQTATLPSTTDQEDTEIETKQDEKVTDVEVKTDPPSNSFERSPSSLPSTSCKSFPFSPQSCHVPSCGGPSGESRGPNTAFSELSTYQDNDDYHQTKKMSIDTSTKRLVYKEEGKIDALLSVEENPQDILNEAPSLSSNFSYKQI